MKVKFHPAGCVLLLWLCASITIGTVIFVGIKLRRQCVRSHVEACGPFNWDRCTICDQWEWERK